MSGCSPYEIESSVPAASDPTARPSRRLSPPSPSPQPYRTDGAAEVKRHPFFDGIDWANLRAPNAPVPFKPTIASATDTSHFDKFEDTTSPQPSRTSKVMITPPRSADLDDLAFAGFRYRRFSHDTFAGRADADGDAPGRLSTTGMADGAAASSDA